MDLSCGDFRDWRVSVHGADSPTVSFTNLQQAVDFIGHRIRVNKHACHRKRVCRSESQTQPIVIVHLQDLNKRKPLRTLYAGKAFPAEAAAFKLGGHMSELGYVHIDFVHTNLGWELKGIWECK